MGNKAGQIAKGITAGVKNYFDIMGERQKIMGQIAVNNMKAKENWLYKLQENELQTPIEREKLSMMKEMRGQGGVAGARASNPYERPVASVAGQEVPYGQTVQGANDDVFAAQPKPQIRMTGKGDFSVYNPPRKEAIYERIQQKKNAGMPLTINETKFESNYLGIKADKEKKEPTAAQMETELKHSLKTKMMETGIDSLTPEEKFVVGYKDSKTKVASHADAMNKLEEDALKQLDIGGEASLSESQKWALKLGKTKKGVSDTQNFRDDVSSAKAGKVSWKDLQDKYPDKLSAISSIQAEYETRANLKAEPIKPWFGMSANSKIIAENISTRAQLKDLVQRQAAYRAKGVDVQRIMNHFKDDIDPSWYGKSQ